MPERPLDRYREFLKDTIRQEIDFSQTDQHRGVPPPPLEKPFPPTPVRFDLPPVGQWEGIGTVDLATAIGDRQSHRSFSPEPLTLDELSLLLWATQGVRERLDDGHRSSHRSFCREPARPGNIPGGAAVSAAWSPASTATCRWSTNCCTCSTRSRCPGS